MKLLKPLFACALTALLATSCRSQNITSPPQTIGNSFVYATNVPQVYLTFTTNTNAIAVSGAGNAADNGVYSNYSTAYVGSSVFWSTNYYTYGSEYLGVARGSLSHTNWNFFTLNPGGALLSNDYCVTNNPATNLIVPPTSGWTTNLTLSGSGTMPGPATAFQTITNYGGRMANTALPPQTHFTLVTNTQVILVSGGTDPSSTNDIYLYSASQGYFTNVNGTYYLGTSNQLAAANNGYSNTGFSAICAPGFGGHEPFIYTNALNVLTGTGFVFDNWSGSGGSLTNSHPVAAYQIVTNYP